MADSRKDWNPDVRGEVPIVSRKLYHSLTPEAGEGSLFLSKEQIENVHLLSSKGMIKLIAAFIIIIII